MINVRATSEVIKYDVQMLFGRSMKQSEVVNELLPQSTYGFVEKPVEAESGLPSLEDWLKGLQQ